MIQFHSMREYKSSRDSISCILSYVAFP